MKNKFTFVVNTIEIRGMFATYHQSLGLVPYCVDGIQRVTQEATLHKEAFSKGQWKHINSS